MRVYIAGPMRGHEDFNHPAFDAAQKQLEAWGYETFNPAEEDRETYGDNFNADNADDAGFSIREALGSDLAWITEYADAVAVLDGWADSRGAKAEVATAEALGLPWAPVEDFDPCSPWVPVADFEPFSDSEAAEHLHSLYSETLDAATNELGAHCAVPHRFYSKTFDAMTEKPSVRAVPQWMIEDELLRPTITAELPDDGPSWETGQLDHPGEIRTTSSTGGQKGVKPARFDLIPSRPLWAVAELYGRGAEKYAARNWENGYEWSKSFAALQRHAHQFWQGIDLDDETGMPHLASVVFHAFAMLEWSDTHPEFDDRPVTS